MSCSAVGCTSHRTKGNKMFSFPREPTRRRMWEAFVGRIKWNSTVNSQLCMEHFEKYSLTVNKSGKPKLCDGAVPTLKSGIEETTYENVEYLEDEYENVAPHINVFHTAEPHGNGSQYEEFIDEDMSNINQIATLKEKLAYYKETQKTLVLKFQRRGKVIKSLREKLKRYEKNYRNQIFNPDQMQHINGLKKVKWGNSTLRTSLQIKFACGSRGYKYLRKIKYPLPGERTLRRKMQNLNFEPSVLTDILKFLEIKIQSMTTEETHCGLYLDEMKIEKGTEYDNNSDRFLGKITIPSFDTLATNALVILLGGLSSRWKQVVAYHYTGHGTLESHICDVVKEVITKCEEIGFHIHFITSDMGPMNQQMWNELGIKHSKNNITNSIVHPLDNSRKLWIFADVPHLLKNFAQSLLNNRTITTSSAVQHMYELPTNEIKADHIQKLVNYQEGRLFKLAPHLEQYMMRPNSFQKMRVATSYYVLNEDVSAALEYLSKQHGDNSLQTTAWFLRVLHKWFALSSNRGPSLALSLNNMESYNNKISFLNEFVEITSELKIGPKGIWKPVQTGIALTTASTIELTEYLLRECNFKFVLTGRFSQDCVENLFSSIRAKQSKPSALQFKQNLKLICVSQYLDYSRSSSYEEDDREHLDGFLTYLQSKPASTDEQEFNYEELSENDLQCVELDCTAKNILYNIAGYILSGIQMHNNICESCFKDLITDIPLDVYSSFVAFKELEYQSINRDSLLIYPGEETFNYFVKMEKIYQVLEERNITDTPCFREQLKKHFSEIPHNFLGCHNIRDLLVHRYSLFRCRIASKKREKAGNIVYGRSSLQRNN